MQKKIDASRYDTDKAVHPPHLEYYAEYFASFVAKDVRLLELGIYKGGSMLLWRDYFARGIIAGLDINPAEISDPTDRIRTYIGRQEDIALLDQIARDVAPEGFDIIIDDCSHIGEPTRISFWHLFNHHLKPSGVYAIEDWGTGYWDSWPDGKSYSPVSEPSPKIDPKYSYPSLLQTIKRKITSLQSGQTGLKKTRYPSHDYGMVGFVKELVDECGMADITCPGWGISPPRDSKFKKIHISHGLVIIVKSD